MKTTNMVVEIVVGGLQTTLWIIILVVNFLGYSPFEKVNLTNWLGISILLLSLAYTLGVIFDKLWNSLGARYDHKIRNERDIDLFDRNKLNKRRTFIFLNSEAAGQFLDYIRSRMRIARATFFNTFLLWLNLIYFIPNRTTVENKNYIVVFAIVFCCFICMVAGSSWMKLIRTYYKQLNYFYETLTDNKQGKK